VAFVGRRLRRTLFLFVLNYLSRFPSSHITFLLHSLLYLGV